MALFILTDSTANFPEPIKEAENVFVIPLSVHINEEIYKEGIEITNDEYYSRIKKERIFPKTSQPPVGDFLDVLNQMQDGDEAIIVVIASSLSGTINSAQMAADMMKDRDVKIHVMDSYSTTAGLGNFVQMAYELRQQGHNLATIVEHLNHLRKVNRLIFSIENLEYLARGGRIGRVAKYFGSIIQLKPILTMKDGILDVMDKVRTTARANQRIILEVEKNLEEIKRLSVVHVAALLEAKKLRERLQEFYKFEIPIYEVTPVVGAHVGPGTLGLVFYT